MFVKKLSLLYFVQAQYNAESLLTQRDKVSKDVRDAITARAQNFDIILEDVAIVSIERRCPGVSFVFLTKKRRIWMGEKLCH